MGVYWWDSWFDENDSLGTSYAHQLKKEIDFPEGRFTQFDRVLYLLKNCLDELTMNENSSTDTPNLHLAKICTSMTRVLVRQTY
jgi:hypothetical protein